MRVPRRDGGQAVVEIALALPLLAVALLGAAQVVVIATRQVTVVHAARDAVRAASVSADPTTAAALAVGRTLPEARAATVVDGDVVTVTVTVVDPTDVPLVGALLPALTLESRAAMGVEP